MDRLEDISSEVTVTESRPRYTGTYSDILIGRFRNQTVAIKVLKHISRKSLPSMRRKIQREREVWAVLLHPNIVPFYGYAEDEAAFGLFGALISPWHPYGDAGQFLEAYGEMMNLPSRSSMWRGVIQGVSYLHTYSPSIVHGDLKPGNILIDNKLNPRICDFGLARILLEEGTSGLTTTSEHSGTERYLAYELVMSDEMSVPTLSSDVYALACIGFELPYAHRKNNVRGHIFQDIRNQIPPARRPTSKGEHFGHLWDIFEACWKLNPEDRVDVGGIAHQHEEWHKLLESEERAFQRYNMSEITMIGGGDSTMKSSITSGSTSESDIRPSLASTSRSNHSRPKPLRPQKSAPNFRRRQQDEVRVEVQGKRNTEKTSNQLKTMNYESLSQGSDASPPSPPPFSESHLRPPLPSIGSIAGGYQEVHSKQQRLPSLLSSASDTLINPDGRFYVANPSTQRKPWSYSYATYPPPPSQYRLTSTELPNRVNTPNKGHVTGAKDIAEQFQNSDIGSYEVSRLVGVIDPDVYSPSQSPYSSALKDSTGPVTFPTSGSSYLPAPKGSKALETVSPRRDAIEPQAKVVDNNLNNALGKASDTEFDRLIKTIKLYLSGRVRLEYSQTEHPFYPRKLYQGTYRISFINGVPHKAHGDLCASEDVAKESAASAARLWVESNFA